MGGDGVLGDVSFLKASRESVVMVGTVWIHSQAQMACPLEGRICSGGNPRFGFPNQMMMETMMLVPFSFLRALF